MVNGEWSEGGRSLPRRSTDATAGARFTRQPQCLYPLFTIHQSLIIID
jgi:hypothetical protein